MGTTPRVLMTATLLALGSTAVLLAQERPPPPKPFVTGTTRYEGTAAVPVKGAPVTLQVLRKNYGVFGPKAQITLPETGFMVIHLRVGRVATTINGERRERTPGEFWTVPAGAQLSIEVLGESASLETFSVK